MQTLIKEGNQRKNLNSTRKLQAKVKFSNWLARPPQPYFKTFGFIPIIPFRKTYLAYQVGAMPWLPAPEEDDVLSVRLCIMM